MDFSSWEHRRLACSGFAPSDAGRPGRPRSQGENPRPSFVPNFYLESKTIVGFEQRSVYHRHEFSGQRLLSTQGGGRINFCCMREVQIHEN